MAAAITDKFKKAGASTVTSLAAPGKAIGATSITVGSTTNYPLDTGVVVAIRVVDTAGALVAGTYTEWNAIVTSATSFTLDPIPVYGSDQVYAAGSSTQVYISVSSSAHNQLVDGLLVAHNQDGTLKSTGITGLATLTTADANDVVLAVDVSANTSKQVPVSGLATAVAANLPAGSVAGTAIASGSSTIGYAEITSNFTSTTASSFFDVTGLSTTVTVPSGGRRVKITCANRSIKSTEASGNGLYLEVYDATASASLGILELVNTGVGWNMNGNFSVTHVPAAGSRTYKIRAQQGTAGTFTMVANAYIQVEVLL